MLLEPNAFARSPTSASAAEQRRRRPHETRRRVADGARCRAEQLFPGVALRPVVGGRPHLGAAARARARSRRSGAPGRRRGSSPRAPRRGRARARAARRQAGRTPGSPGRPVRRRPADAARSRAGRERRARRPRRPACSPRSRRAAARAPPGSTPARSVRPGATRSTARAIAAAPSRLTARKSRRRAALISPARWITTSAPSTRRSRAGFVVERAGDHLRRRQVAPFGHVGLAPQQQPHPPAGAVQLGDEVPADEAGGAGHRRERPQSQHLLSHSTVHHLFREDREAARVGFALETVPELGQRMRLVFQLLRKGLPRLRVEGREVQSFRPARVVLEVACVPFAAERTPEAGHM